MVLKMKDNVKWKGTKDSFLIKHGWVKVKGFKIDMRYLEDYYHLDYVYFEDIDEFVSPCEYWTDEEGEKAYELLTEVIENHFDEYLDDDDNLWREPLC